MIVLEGPDGGGKSTLILELTKLLNLKARHFGGPPKTLEELSNRVNESKGEALLDRWSPISEQVYGPIANRRWSVDVLDSYIIQERPFVIYCRPARAILIQNKMRCLEATKAHKTFKHIQMVSRNYDDVIEGYNRVMLKVAKYTDVYEYDYTKIQALPDLLTHLRKYT